MASFKPTDIDADLPAKRKWMTNPKLLDNDNVSLDAIKRRKLESLSSTLPTASTSNLETTLSAQPSRTSSSTNSSQQASVETVADEDDMPRRNAGQPKNPRFILESTDDDDEDSTHPAPKKTQTHKEKTLNCAENNVESSEKEIPNEESDDEELSESHNLLMID
jgi:hypothetical protein